MCVKNVPYSGSSSYQDIWGSSMFIYNPSSLNHSGSLYSFLLWSCLDGYNPRNIGKGILHLYLCHMIWTIVASYQQQLSLVFSKLFWWHKISANLEYLHLGSSQSYWMSVIHENNASVIVLYDNLFRISFLQCSIYPWAGYLLLLIESMMS